MLGAPASDLQNYGLFDRIHIADRPAYLRALSEAAASGDTCEIEFRLRREAKAEFTWIEMRCWSSDGNLYRGRDAASAEVVAVMRDITLRKARQDALLEAGVEAARANAAKSRFLACMSHELRTPLTAIIGFSDLLRNSSENLIDTTRALEYARIINESGHHLLAVANEILDLSRLETGNFGLFPQPLRLDAVVAGCAELVALRAQEAGVTFNTEVPTDLPEIVADRRAVMQILINLISNAIKFSDPGGTVAVSAGVDGEHAWLEVADTGIGIAPDDLTRIGNPFFQVQGRYGRKHGGAGLGLSIVKGLVDLHGGELKAESGPGEGTRMVVRLPPEWTFAGAPDIGLCGRFVPTSAGRNEFAGRFPTPGAKACVRCPLQNAWWTALGKCTAPLCGYGCRASSDWCCAIRATACARSPSWRRSRQLWRTACICSRGGIRRRFLGSGRCPCCRVKKPERSLNCRGGGSRPPMRKSPSLRRRAIRFHCRALEPRVRPLLRAPIRPPTPRIRCGS